MKSLRLSSVIIAVGFLVLFCFGNLSYFFFLLFLFAADLAQELHQAFPDTVSALW